MAKRTNSQRSEEAEEQNRALAGTWHYRAILELLTSGSEMAQSFEALVSNLQLFSAARPLKAVLVTSSMPKEGKTTVSTALALSMTIAGKKVLVVDADLRKPRLHTIFGVNNSAGLNDILSGNLGFQEAVQSVDVTDEVNACKRTLSLLTSGNPVRNIYQMMELLKSKMDSGYLRNMYDFTVLDSPPILATNDALALAPMVDGVILVLRTGMLTEEDAKRTKDRLEQAGAHILGVVMNRFVHGEHGREFHPYQDYYAQK